jgi:hypothetical protein
VARCVKAAELAPNAMPPEPSGGGGSLVGARTRAGAPRRRGAREIAALGRGVLNDGDDPSPLSELLARSDSASPSDSDHSSPSLDDADGHDSDDDYSVRAPKRRRKSRGAASVGGAAAAAGARTRGAAGVGGGAPAAAGGGSGGKADRVTRAVVRGRPRPRRLSALSALSALLCPRIAVQTSRAPCHLEPMAAGLRG